MKRKIHSDVFLAIVLFAIGLTMLIMSFKFPQISRRFPAVATGLLMLFSIIILIQGIIKTKNLPADYVSPYNWQTIKYPLLMFLALVIYYFLIKYVNFFVATVIYDIGVMIFCGVKSKKAMILETLFINVFVWFLFVYEFKMVLP